MSDSARRSVKREQALGALLTAPSIQAAAAGLGIAESSVRRWLRRPAFLAAYRQARRQVVEAAIGRLQQAANNAVDALERNLACGHAGTEVRAAVAVLKAATEGLTLMDLEERLEALEGRVQEAAQTAGQV